MRLIIAYLLFFFNSHPRLLPIFSKKKISLRKFFSIYGIKFSIAVELLCSVRTHSFFLYVKIPAKQMKIYVHVYQYVAKITKNGFVFGFLRVSVFNAVSYTHLTLPTN